MNIRHLFDKLNLIIELIPNSILGFFVNFIAEISHANLILNIAKQDLRMIQILGYFFPIF